MLKHRMKTRKIRIPPKTCDSSGQLSRYIQQLDKLYIIASRELKLGKGVLKVNDINIKKSKIECHGLELPLNIAKHLIENSPEILKLDLEKAGEQSENKSTKIMSAIKETVMGSEKIRAAELENYIKASMLSLSLDLQD